MMRTGAFNKPPLLVSSEHTILWRARQTLGPPKKQLLLTNSILQLLWNVLMFYNLTFDFLLALWLNKRNNTGKTITGTFLSQPVVMGSYESLSVFTKIGLHKNIRQKVNSISRSKMNSCLHQVQSFRKWVKWFARIKAQCSVSGKCVHFDVKFNFLLQIMACLEGRWKNSWFTMKCWQRGIILVKMCKFVSC